MEEEAGWAALPSKGPCVEASSLPSCEYALKCIDLPSVAQAGSVGGLAEPLGGVRLWHLQGLLQSCGRGGRRSQTQTQSQGPPCPCRLHLRPGRTFHEPGSSLRPKSGLFARASRVYVTTALGAGRPRFSGCERRGSQRLLWSGCRWGPPSDTRTDRHLSKQDPLALLSGQKPGSQASRPSWGCLSCRKKAALN